MAPNATIGMSRFGHPSIEALRHTVRQRRFDVMMAAACPRGDTGDRHPRPPRSHGKSCMLDPSPYDVTKRRIQRRPM